MEQKTYTLVTHNGKFHADDIFACATLQLILDNEGKTYNVIRTRDEKLIDQADYVFDVGGIHDPATNRFDHHQHGGAGERANGIKYAAFGLVWKTYGPILAGDIDKAERIEKILVQPIDADDNGIPLVDLKYDVSPFRVQEVFYLFRSTWKEDEALFDVTFLENVELAKKILLRLVKVVSDVVEAEVFVERAYQEAPDKRIIVLDDTYPYEHVLTRYPEPLFVVRPRPMGNWGLNTISMSEYVFAHRKSLPEMWAGLRDEALQQVTGVSDAEFCHNGRFLAVAKTKEGILKLAQIALDL